MTVITDIERRAAKVALEALKLTLARNVEQDVVNFNTDQWVDTLTEAQNMVDEVDEIV
jgi:hypothetical protein